MKKILLCAVALIAFAVGVFATEIVLPLSENNLVQKESVVLVKSQSTQAVEKFSPVEASLFFRDSLGRKKAIKDFGQKTNQQFNDLNYRIYANKQFYDLPPNCLRE